MKTKDFFRYTDREQAIAFQRATASRVLQVDEPNFEPRLICGIDVSYDRETAYATAVVWDIKREILVETATKKDSVPHEYFPGLLGFREGPILTGVARMLRSRPEVFLVDGQGVAHPRRFGLASHFGIAIEKPTIGVAKSLLYGRVKDDTILDPDGITIGKIVSSPKGKKFYVSVGHRITLDTALRLVSDCLSDGHPVPLRQAHLDSLRSRRSGLN